MVAQRKLSGTSFAARRRHGKRAAVLACALERGERLRGGASRRARRRCAGAVRGARAVAQASRQLGACVPVGRREKEISREVQGDIFAF